MTDKNGLRSPVVRPLLALPDPETLRGIIGPDGLSQLKAQADEIVASRARLFGGQPVPLVLTTPGVLCHWTDYALGKSAFPNHQSPNCPITDIKFTWEPARFGWAFTLGRAYHLTGDERYPAAFWRHFETFQQANPANMGPNWESAQEIALRLIAFTFAAQIFADSTHSTAHRTSHLARSIAEHAARIPPTLIYARAQNNNHLLSEAAGLITASLALPDHPDSPRWSKLGWKWFTRGLQTQIAADGSYMQHSTNYHRLMLQLALWVYGVLRAKCEVRSVNAPRTPHPALDPAARWLIALTDPETGRVPNLGPNDGAYILSLTVLPFHDYRPVLQTAAQAFLGQPAFEPGVWDEMSLWLSSDQSSAVSDQLSVNSHRIPLITDHRSPITDHGSLPPPPSTLRAPHSWAYLRAATFTDRPGHADQLHLDLWWRGLNVAQDAGAYLYNADPPWDNALTHTAVHNTVMIDSRQQMTPAGRFLYLDRAQAEVLQREQAEDGSWERIVASHDGYQRIGVTHQRSVTAYQDERWVIEDQLLPISPSALQAPHSARLHWLLPDWAYELRDAECGVRLKSPYGWVDLSIILQPLSFSLQLVRAGKLLNGAGEISPTWGWVSPTYGVKVPALSFALTVVGELPMTLISEWGFPND